MPWSVISRSMLRAFVIVVAARTPAARRMSTLFSTAPLRACSPVRTCPESAARFDLRLDIAADLAGGAARPLLDRPDRTRLAWRVEAGHAQFAQDLRHASVHGRGVDVARVVVARRGDAGAELVEFGQQLPVARGPSDHPPMRERRASPRVAATSRRGLNVPAFLLGALEKRRRDALSLVSGRDDDLQQVGLAVVAEEHVEHALHASVLAARHDLAVRARNENVGQFAIAGVALVVALDVQAGFANFAQRVRALPEVRGIARVGPRSVSDELLPRRDTLAPQPPHVCLLRRVLVERRDLTLTTGDGSRRRVRPDVPEVQPGLQ
jgi:hypothetical protein